MNMEQTSFGFTQAGCPVTLYTLHGKGDAAVEVMTYGGAIRAIRVPDQAGELADVALGFDSLAEYEANGGNMGALVGRMANRIRQGKFTLNNVAYSLYCNNGENHLHGGKVGFDRKVWEAAVQNDQLLLHYHSPDGEEGYPGNLDVTVAYSFSEENALTIDYQAVCDRDTIVNLTNHTYFNLAGHDSGDILNQYLTLNSREYTENDAACLPTGVVASVIGTPFDFTTPHTIGERIGANHEQLHRCGGYDHNFVINREHAGLELAALLWDERSGRQMETYTTQPGVQLYTANFLDGSCKGKGGVPYRKHKGLCLETQIYPDALSHPHFPSPILRAGERYHHTTIYRFSVR